MPRLLLNDSDRKWAEGFWKGEGLCAENRQNVVVLHPGSGSRKKVWPVERFFRLGEYLNERFGFTILLVIGPAETGDVRKRCREMTSRGAVLAEDLPLTRLASVIEGCGFFIGNDSGVSHLAAALGVGTVAVFGAYRPASAGLREEGRSWSSGGRSSVLPVRETVCSDATVRNV